MYLEILLSGQILHYPVVPFTNAIAVVSQHNTKFGSYNIQLKDFFIPGV
ncbi:hypothetical protein NIES3974_44900 [Calothrix sp. NIES-3974]|nr:hypothetical protein NIES3974_44900 [Calothrix sp. NIES-3974]